MNGISLVGNLTGDPQLNFGDSGKARVSFSVAVNEGQGDTERTHFVNVTAFDTLAKNIAASLKKGMRVAVIGRLNTYSKEVVIDGEARSLTMTSVTANAVGPDLRWATADVKKVAKRANDADEVVDDAKPPKAAPKTSSAPADDDDF